MMSEPYDEGLLSAHARQEISDVVPNVGEHYPIGYDCTLRVAPTGTQKLLSTLFLQVHDALAKSHVDGAETGKSILLGLASGDMTVKDFNQCTVESKDDDS